ncbi:MAG: thioredoxin family protein [Candidatus Lokiarchaeota archaeon]|nr:thioredoxin family protein [Candidatus Lokiarchaeota archaeon]
MDIKELRQYGIDGSNKGKLIVDISSDWCGPCKLLTPVLEKFRDEGFIELIKINIDENHELSQILNVYAVPTLLFFKDGKLLDKDIKIHGETLVNRGVMIGATGEIILKKIIEQM